MRINWFSPLPPDHTDIANYSERILPALIEKFDPCVWTGTEKWTSRLDEICQIKHVTKKNIDWKELNLGGVPIYHVGNNIHFHGDIIRIARQCPGIVVLHDLSVHETIMNLCLKEGHGRAEYFDVLYRYGGSEAVELGRRYLDENDIDTNELSKAHPLFEFVIRNARGVITHNPLNIDHIRKHTPAPVMYVPLPYLRVSELNQKVIRSPKENSPYQIVLFGFLGSSNRRLKPFLEAFLECNSKDRYRVVIAGKYKEKEVNKWVRELSLSKHVQTRGFLPEKDLESLLHESDLCINLRWPTRGESSGTQLRIWNHSLPALVTDTDYYSTIPKETVALVDPANEKSDIIRHLDSFAGNPMAYYQKGLAGRQLLEHEHSADAFCNYLQKFIPVVNSSGSLPYLQAFTKSLGRNFLVNYPNPTAREALVERCAKEIAKWEAPLETLGERTSDVGS